MEIRIGITNAPRELSFESNQKAEDVRTAVTTALEAAAPVLTLTDHKGSEYIIPTAGLAYIEIGSEETRRVGFVA